MLDSDLLVTKRAGSRIPSLQILQEGYDTYAAHSSTSFYMSNFLFCIKRSAK
jgi:hypothetical protein